MAEKEFVARLKKDIITAEAMVEDARKELQRAEQAGIDVKFQKAEFEKSVDQLRKIKAVYAG